MEIENTIVLVPQTEDDECPKLIELKLRPQLLQNYTSSNQNENSFHNRLNTNEEFSNNLKSSVTTYHNDNDILCLICGVRFNISGIEPPLNIFKEKENIGLNNFSEMNLFTLLCNILHLELNKENVYSEHICSSCYNILDEWNEIYAKLKNIEKIVTFMFEETCKRLKDQHLKTEKEDTIHGEEEEIEEEINFRIRTKHRRTKSRKPPSITIVPEDNLPPIKLQPRPPEQPSKSVLIEEKLEVNDECAKSDETAASQDEKLPKNSETMTLTSMKTSRRKNQETHSQLKIKIASDPQKTKGAIKWCCHLCNLEFMSSSDYIKHTKRHSNALECNVCGKFIRKKGMLLQHQRKFHGNYLTNGQELQQNSCTICDKVYQSKSALSYHIQSVHAIIKLNCEFCDKSFKHYRNLSAHKLRHGKKTKMCPYCKASFYTTSELGYHVNGLHTQAKCWKCHICSKEFSRGSSLHKHLAIHKGLRYNCQNCSNSFSRKTTLALHEKTHK